MKDTFKKLFKTSIFIEGIIILMASNFLLGFKIYKLATIKNINKPTQGIFEILKLTPSQEDKLKVIELVKNKESWFDPDKFIKYQATGDVVKYAKIALSSLFDKKYYPQLEEDAEKLFILIQKGLEENKEISNYHKPNLEKYVQSKEPFELAKYISNNYMPEFSEKITTMAKNIANKLYHYDDKLFIVSYTFQDRNAKLEETSRGHWWEVDLDSEIVRQISASNDLELLRKYGLGK